MSQRRRGELNGFFGHRHSPATLVKLRENSYRLWAGKTFRKRMAEGHRRAIERKRAEAQQ